MPHRETVRGISWRARSIALLAPIVLIQACSTDLNPLGAGPPAEGSPPSVENPPVAEPPPTAPPGTPPATGGSLEVLVTGATPVQAQQYDLYVRPEGSSAVTTITFNEGATFRNLLAGAYTGWLVSRFASCTVVDAEPRAFAIVAGQTATVRFAVACETVVPPGTYERTSPEDVPVWDWFHLAEDGSFRFAASGGFSTFGTYSAYRETAGSSVVRFKFSAFGDAIGTLDGDCLTVEYDLRMILTDFWNGVYCRT